MLHQYFQKDFFLKHVNFLSPDGPRGVGLGSPILLRPGDLSCELSHAKKACILPYAYSSRIGRPPYGFSPEWALVLNGARFLTAHFPVSPAPGPASRGAAGRSRTHSVCASQQEAPGRCVASPHTGAPCRAPPAAVRRPCWRPSAGLPSAESLGSRCWDDAEASPTPPHGGLLPRGRPALGQREPSLGPDHAAPGAGLLCPGALTSHPPRRPVRKGPAAGSEPYQGARPPGEGARPDREPPEPPRSPRARPHGPAGSPEAPPHAARTRRRARPGGRAGLRGGRRRSLRRGCGPLPGLGSPEACRFSFFGRKQLPLFELVSAPFLWPCAVRSSRRRPTPVGRRPSLPAPARGSPRLPSRQPAGEGRPGNHQGAVSGHRPRGALTPGRRLPCWGVLYRVFSRHAGVAHPRLVSQERLRGR